MRGTCHIPLHFPLISPGVSPVVRLAAGLQLAEELAGAPVDGDDALVVEDLPDISELLVSGRAGPLTAVTPLALTGAGVCLVLLGMISENETTSSTAL